MQSLDQLIAASLEESRKSGELKRARRYGRPLELDPGIEETPEELRLAFKILKESGFIPPEVEKLKQLSELRTRLAGLTPDHPDYKSLRLQIAQLDVSIAVRLECLKNSKGP